MSHGSSYGRLLVVMVAGVAVHSFSLSAEEALHHALAPLPAVAPILHEVCLALGLLACLLAIFLARLARGQIRLGVQGGDQRPIRGLLRIALEIRSPGWPERAWLLALGLIGLLFLAGLHVVAHEAWHAVHGFGNGWVVLGGIGIAIGIGEYIRRSEQPEITVRQGQVGKIEALVLFLSTPPDSPPGSFAHAVQALGNDWSAEAIRSRLSTHVWAIPLRSIQEVRAGQVLKYVMVIGSSGDKSSWAVFSTFADGLRPSLPAVELQLWPPQAGVDFTDPDALKHALHEVYAWLDAKGVQRVAIDLTSGTKLCTVMGLEKALEPGRAALYVNGDLTVRAYDLEHSARGWHELSHEEV